MLRESADQKVTLNKCNNCAFDLIWVRDRKGRLYAFLALYSVCMCVYIPMPGEVQGVTTCCDCRGGGQCVCASGREQMPAVRWGVSAHFDCSARTDRGAGGAQVGVSVGCGGLWVMPDFSALYAPHVFILHMLQTSAPLPTSYCVSLQHVYCVFKVFSNVLYSLSWVEQL